MSGEEGSLREIWAAFSLITRRLDDLAASVAHLAPAAPAPVAGAPLDEQARRRLAALASLLAIGPGLSREEAALLAVDRAIHRARADCAAVLMVGEDGRLAPVVQRGFAPRLPAGLAADGIAGRAMVDAEPILGGPADRDTDPLMRGHALRQALVLPIRAPGASPGGVLFAGRRRAAEFDPEAVEALVLVADRLGLLTVTPPTATSEPAAGIAAAPAELDLDRTAAAVVHAVATTLGASAVALLLPEAGGLTLAAQEGLAVGSAPLAAGTGALAAVLETRRSWTPAEGGADEALARFLGAPPQLVAPLLDGDRLVAILAIGGPRPAARTALDALLPPAAVALRNARLHTETVQALAELQTTESPAVDPVPAPARDFANLLAVVLGRLAAVRERAGDPGIRGELAVAEEAAWRAAEAVRGLLGFAPGHRTGALGPVDVGAMLRAAVEQARRRWTAHAAAPTPVRLDLEPVPPVRGNADDLREALDLLLENAAEATLDGSPVAVRARWDGGGVVEILVEDGGTGMEDTAGARALEPFFTTKGPGRLGLGLPVVQAIVARHRGELGIVSAVGRGTTVRVTLPTVASTRRPPGGVAAPVARVLVVEDEGPVREALVQVVAQLGHVALTAADAAEALDAVRREPVDVVVTDLALPSGSGLEVARRVRRLRPGTAVILVTAWPGRVDPARLEESGVDAVIEKPVGLPELRLALAAALARRGTRPA